MPSSYTTSLRLTLPATGELSGQWGNTVNTGITELLDAAVAGTASISTWGGAGVAYTLSNNSGTADEARKMFIVATGSPGEAKNVICPAVSKFYVFRNDTTGGYALTLKTSGGTGIAVPAGQYKFLYCDGTNVVEMFNSAGALTLSGALTVGGTATFSSNPTFSAGTANGVLYLNGSKVATSGTALAFNGTSLLVGKNSSDANNWGVQNYATNAFGSGMQLTYGGVGSAGLWVPAASSLAFGADAGSGTTELMRLTSTGLGIGTSSPSFKFDAQRTTAGTVGRFYSTAGTDANISIKNNTQEAIVGADNTQSYLLNASAYPWTFWTNNLERMRLDSSGNLGIGTSSPSVKLDVQNGNATINRATNATILVLGGAPAANWEGDIQFVTSNTNTNWRLASNRNTSGAFTITPSTAAGGSTFTTPAVTLDSSGNLGLGVTPYSGGTGWKTMDVATYAAYAQRAAGTSDAVMSWNAYIVSGSVSSGTGYRYKTSGDVASAYEQNGAHRWYTAPSGTAGNAISFGDTKMTLDVSGRLLLGVTSAAGNAGFQLKGASSGYVRVEGTSSTLFAGDAPQLITGAAATESAIRADGALLFASGGGTERARITSGGNLLVGSTIDSGSKLQVGSSSGSVATPTAIEMDQTYATTAGFDKLKLYLFKGASESYGFGLGTSGDVQYWAGSSSTGIHRWFTSQTERARITSGGDLLVGVTSTIGSNLNTNTGAQISKTYSWFATTDSVYIQRPDGTDGNVMQFLKNAGALGSISLSGSSTSYNTSSDRRLKENIQPADDAGAVIDAIQVVKHDWKIGGHTRYGMIAQDLNAVAPEAVNAGDDGDEIEKAWGVDYSKLVPMLIKEIQSLRARVQALEAQP